MHPAYGVAVEALVVDRAAMNIVFSITTKIHAIAATRSSFIGACGDDAIRVSPSLIVTSATVAPTRIPLKGIVVLFVLLRSLTIARHR